MVTLSEATKDLNENQKADNEIRKTMFQDPHLTNIGCTLKLHISGHAFSKC